MAPFTGNPSNSQMVALAIVPKVAGVFSMMGSGYIVYDVLRRNNRRKRSTSSYHRILLGLSLNDIIMSFGLFTSTWPMPVDTPSVWGARGNTATCEAIGFLEQAGVAAVLYSGSLSTYYLLKIRYGWTDAYLKRVEVWFHAIPIVFALATMIAGIPLKLYNSGIFDCWIAPLPLNCNQSWRHPDPSDPAYVPCERGDNASIYQWAFDIIPKFSSIFLVTINMVLTYLEVRRRETKVVRYSVNNNSNSNNNKSLRLSQRMARQSYLYVGALYVTYIPVAMTRMTQLIAGYTFYGMILTIAITIPMQGCWNLLVYLRPRFLLIRDQQRMQRERSVQRNGGDGGGKSPEASATTSSDNSGVMATGLVPLKSDIVSAVSEAIRKGELDEEEYDEEAEYFDEPATNEDAKQTEEPRHPASVETER